MSLSRLAKSLIVITGTAACSDLSPPPGPGVARDAIVYGNDDRREAASSTLAGVQALAASSAALIEASRIDSSDPQHITLSALSLAEREGVCPDERFADQPTAADCSATLVAPDLVVTAGHCITAASCDQVRVVFDYALGQDGALEVISAEDVYACAAVAARAHGGVLDYAVVRLDRPVQGRTPVPVRLGSAPLATGDAVFVIGYPSGLPQKVADDARVSDPRERFLDYFSADLDAFPGNSGSGVFSAATLELVGILARGPAGGYVRRPGEACARVERVPQDHPLQIESVYVHQAVQDFCDGADDAVLCACGDGVCEAGARETTATCPADCGARCGDAACNGGETAESCYEDCGACGNAICEPHEITNMSCCRDCGCPSAYSCEEGACVPRLGNVNGDAAVDEHDVAGLEQAIAGGAALPFRAASADVDCDGAVTARDLDALEAVLRGEQARLPCHAVEDLALGLLHTCALSAGEVRCWGENTHGQLGTDAEASAALGAADAPALPLGRRVTALAAGNHHTCALDEAGRVTCWGRNDLGQLGRPTRSSEHRFSPLELGEPATMIRAGTNHTCALLESGAVKCWGDHRMGQLGHPAASEDLEHAPAVQFPHAVREIAAGGSHTCALLVNGEVRCWGLNTFGQLGLSHRRTIGDDERPDTEPAVRLGAPAQHIRAHWMHTCAILTGGEVVCWGDNLFGQLGYPFRTSVGDDETPESVGTAPVGPGLVDLALGQSRTCALYEDGAVRCWGLNSSGQLGQGHTSPVPPQASPWSLQPLELGAPAARLVSGSQHTCAVLRNEGLRCWGLNQSGQLGFPHRENVGDSESPAAAGEVPLHGESSAGWVFVNPHDLDVWMLDKGTDEKSSAIALFIENTGQHAISDFRALYALSGAEMAGVDVAFLDNYTPWSTPRLRAEKTAGAYTLDLDFGGRTLLGGQATSLGEHGGERIVLHFASWKRGWDTGNDYSASERHRRHEWHRTTRVQVVDREGRVLYGWSRPPSGG